MVAAICRGSDCIFHVHGKDCYIDPLNVAGDGGKDQILTTKRDGARRQVRVLQEVVGSLPAEACKMFEVAEWQL